MMKAKLAVLFVFMVLGCKAQYNILPMNRMDHDNLTVINTQLSNYYKDLDNELDYYVGTWKYENGNTSFTVKLQKVTQVPENENVTDELIGEYRYVNDGNEIVNSFNRLNNPNFNTAQHFISGARFIPQFLFPHCTDCDPQKTRVKLSLMDPGRKWVLLNLVLQHIVENGQEKLKATVFSSGIGILPSPDVPTTSRIPEQQYILVKQ